MSEEKEEREKSIGALWARTSRNNSQFLSGNIELPDGTKFKIVCFANKSDNPKAPTWKIFQQKNYTKKEPGDFGDKESELPL